MFPCVRWAHVCTICIRRIVFPLGACGRARPGRPEVRAPCVACRRPPIGALTALWRQGGRAVSALEAPSRQWWKARVGVAATEAEKAVAAPEEVLGLLRAAKQVLERRLRADPVQGLRHVEGGVLLEGRRGRQIRDGVDDLAEHPAEWPVAVLRAPERTRRGQRPVRAEHGRGGVAASRPPQRLVALEGLGEDAGALAAGDAAEAAIHGHEDGAVLRDLRAASVATEKRELAELLDRDSREVRGHSRRHPPRYTAVSVRTR
mmetsp:Transcript_118347/g.331469  ORF Transcript_118347/g.331469 Transcript_118347/m.331469 type:complete len:261 (+) Transcript_118347:332-1114(+)